MSVFLADEQEDPIEVEPLRRLAELVIEAERLPQNAEATILLVGEQQIADYNERFMGRSGPTDVLAFPLEQLTPGRVPTRPADGPPFNIGDVVIAPRVVRRQAAEAGVSFEDELSLMVVHGLLHLLGYDHQDDRQALQMEERERHLLGRAGRRRP